MGFSVRWKDRNPNPSEYICSDSDEDPGVNIWERRLAQKMMDMLPQVPPPPVPKPDPWSLLPEARHLCPGGDISTEGSTECGNVSAVLRCNCGSDPQFYVSGCRNRGCIVCWPRWQHRSVRSGVARVAGHFAYKHHISKNCLAPRHIVLSPPPMDFTSPPRASLIDQAKVMRRFVKAVVNVQKTLHLDAAVAIDHCYRLASFSRWDPDQTDAEIFRKEVKTARANRYRLILDNELDPSKRLVLSPHRHLIVFGPIPDAGEFYRKTGWVIKIIADNKRSRSWEPLDVVPMVEARLRYLLSHAWSWGNGNVLRYYGGLQRHPEYVLSKDTALTPAYCEDCGERLQKWSNCEADGSPGLNGVFVGDALTRASSYSIRLTDRSPELISRGLHEVIDYLGYAGIDRIYQELGSPPRQIPSDLINLSPGSCKASGCGRFPEWLQVLADRDCSSGRSTIEANQLASLEFDLQRNSEYWRSLSAMDKRDLFKKAMDKSELNEVKKIR